MQTDAYRRKSIAQCLQRGVTLIELMVFIVIVGIALSSLLLIYNRAVVDSVDPVIRVQLAELAQSHLEEVLARKYDEATPSGGIPACDSGEVTANACVGIGLDGGESLADKSTLDDVDDFDNFTDSPQAGFSRSVAVSFAGTDLGLAAEQAKLISVTVSAPGNQQLTLSVYRTNF